MIQERRKIDNADGRESCWKEAPRKQEQTDSVHKQRGWSYTGISIDSKHRKAGRELGVQTEVADKCDGGSL